MQHTAKPSLAPADVRMCSWDSSLVSGTELFGLIMTITTPTQVITFGNECQRLHCCTGTRRRSTKLSGDSPKFLIAGARWFAVQELRSSLHRGSSRHHRFLRRAGGRRLRIWSVGGFLFPCLVCIANILNCAVSEQSLWPQRTHRASQSLQISLPQVFVASCEPNSRTLVKPRSAKHCGVPALRSPNRDWRRSGV